MIVESLCMRIRVDKVVRVDIGDIILIQICSFNNSSSIMVGVEVVDSECILDGVEGEKEVT